MKKLIYVLTLVLLFLVYVVAANIESVVLSLTLKYSDGKITKEKVRLIEGTPPDKINEPDFGYTAKVISFDNRELYSIRFEIPLIRHYEPLENWFDEEGNQIVIPNETFQVEEKERIFFLNLPYFKTAESVEIYDPDSNKVLTVDISEYAVCNLNSICDNRETRELCPEDCSPETLKSKSFLQWLINLIKSLFG